MAYCELNSNRMIANKFFPSSVFITEEHATRFSQIKNASFPTRSSQPLLPERDVELAKICTPSYHEILKKLPFGNFSNECLQYSLTKSRLNRLNPSIPWVFKVCEKQKFYK